ncbi:MAG: hypothetical protein C0403_17220 [Desulfobacterium sp.]|nr:hypothetical protein [Desulfobacterium sp.]
MDYFEILNLSKEPFSNSPDPEFFFQSRQHKDCLQKLEISIRLRRGLNVVVGDVGTGKTTLCRQLIQKFSTDEKIETYLMLDPQFPSSQEFLSAIQLLFDEREIAAHPGQEGDINAKERIKQYLFQKGVDENKTIVLIIDEGQKISESCLEILRELLNYETNHHKLLQIIIFAQKEFEEVIAKHENFTDRINLYHRLGPLDFRDTWQMIAFRLQQSSRDKTVRPVFTLLAFIAIYISTSGYPRKIINLCHQSMLAMIVQNQSKAGWFLIRACARRNMIGSSFAGKLSLTFGLSVLIVICLLLFGNPDVFHFWKVNASEKKQEVLQKDKTTRPRPPAVAGQLKTKIQTAREKAPPIIDSVDQSSETAPRVLGKVSIQKGESLGLISLSIYGRVDPTTLESIVAANPHIARPENIESGTVINLPAVPVRIRNTGLPCWWVRLGEADSPEEAMEFIRSHPDHDPPFRMIPFYSKKMGLKFEMIVKEYFFDKDSAQKLLEKIVTADFPHAGIRSGWGDEKDILYANPYLVYKNGAGMRKE